MARQQRRFVKEIAMQRIERRVVCLGDRRYEVERPWIRLPPGTELKTASDVALDKTGRVYVLQREDPVILVFDRAGELVAEWRDKPMTDGHGIHVSDDGRVFAVDWDNHRIFVFGPDGEVLLCLGDARRPRFGAPFNHPAAVATTPNGDIFIADGYGNSHVHRFTREGRHIATFGSPGSGPAQFTTPHAILVDRQGRLLVTDRENHRVQILSQDGVYLGEIGDLYRPMAVAEGPDGLVYVSDQTPRLSVFDANGRLVGRCRTFGVYGHGVRVGSDGSIFIVEMLPSQVTRLAPLADAQA
jgi:peptidylglycine monooxygenase